MKHLKNYKTFFESTYTGILESLNVWQDALLKSVGSEELNIFDVLDMPKDTTLDLTSLSDSNLFVDSLSSIGLKKSTIQLSDDFETFINKPCKFMFIYDINSNELENPKYLLFQSWNETLKEWEDCKFYKINDDVKKFYDKLSSHIIEIIDGDKKYIYNSSNGNDWELQNLTDKTETYKRFLTKDQLSELLSGNELKFNVL